jgi:hypothetical protein
MSLRIRDESGVDANRAPPECTEAHDVSTTEAARAHAMMTVDRVCMSEF